MATIPIGNFGQRIADTGQAPRLSQGDPIGEANQQLQHTAGAIIAREQAEQKQRDQQSQRAAAALSLAQVNNALHDAHDEAARGIEDGSLGIDQAGPFMNERAAKVRKEFTANLSPEQRQMIDDNIEVTAGNLDRSLNRVISKRKQSETGATIDQFGEQVMRDGMRQGPAWASEKYDAMVDFSAGAAGWSPEAAAKKKQAFREVSHYAFFDAAGTGAYTKGDVEAIQKVRDQMAGSAGESMDPVKRVTLDHQLFGYQQNILAKRAAAANRAAEDSRKQYNEAVDLYNKGSDLALGGAQFSPEFIKEMTTAAEGFPELAQDVVNLIGSQARVAGFATQSAPQRAAILNEWRRERATPGVGTDPMGEKLLKAAETIDGKLRQQVDDNAWVAAQSAGRIREAGEINPGNPSEAIAVVQQRMREIGGVEVWAGKKVSPLQPTEVELVGKMVRSLPVDQAASFLGRLGSSVGDSERVAALAKQMGDKDGTLGLAMMYANSQTTQDRYTAELVLRGEQAIKDKRIKPDEAKETGWRAEIATKIRGAYSNREVEDAAINAAFLILGARTADGSQGDVNVDNAVRLATGGITERNGAKLPLPSGMKEGDFDKAVKAITAQDIAPQAPGGAVFSGLKPIPLADFISSLPSAQLIHAGQGLYNVRSGSTLITNAQGQRITIKVKP